MLPILLAPGPTVRGLVSPEDLSTDPCGTGRDDKPVNRNLWLSSIPGLFEEPEDTDAHVVAYSIVQDGEPLERQPRLNKDALAGVRALGYEVQAYSIWLDSDLKDWIPGSTGKVLWTELSPAQAQEIWAKIEDARIRLAKKGLKWVAAYTTSGGFRFVHVLAVPVPVGPGYEALLSRFRSSYLIAGIPVDEACKDWTRLYRAPMVTKEDGTQTWTADWYQAETNFDDVNCFYIPTEDDLVPPPVVAAVTPIRTARTRPDPDSAMALVQELDERGKLRLTELGKKAKAALKDAACFSWIFEGLPLAKEGKRHDMLTKMVGSLVGEIHGFEWATPELAYGLVYDPANCIGDDDDWTGKAWEMISSWWDRESTRKAQKAAEVTREIEEAVAPPPETEREAFLKGVRSWFREAAGLPDEEVIELVQKRRLGVLQDSIRDRFHVLMKTGFYDDHACGPSTLAKVIEQRGMDWLVPTMESRLDSQGNNVVSAIPEKRIIRQCARVYTAEEIRLDRRGSYLKTDHEGRDVFVQVPFYLRDDIVPEFVPAIHDLWLAGAGGDKDARDERLIATVCLLAFEYGPTAGVLTWGEASGGKTLLAKGLSECISTRRLADGRALVDNFNDALRQSPIVWVEEALDRSTKGIDGSAALRRLITAPSISIEQKGRDRVEMQGVHRVLMTANSTEILDAILGGKARSSSDWRAIAERIAVFHIDDDATRWFEKHNRGWHETRKWVGNFGRDGLYCKHLMWVYHNMLEWKDGRPKMRGRRLLFEGNINSREILSIQATSGCVPEVASTINKMLSVPGTKKAFVEDGFVWITLQTVVEEVLKTSPGAKAPEVRAALTSLLDPMSDGRASMGGVTARWKAISKETLVRILAEQQTLSKPLR